MRYKYPVNQSVKDSQIFNDILETNLFESIEYSWFWQLNLMLQGFELKRTNYLLFIENYQTGEIGTYWINGIRNIHMSFEEVFENSPKRIREKLIWHINILK